MPCYHPLKAFPIGLTDNGKTKYKICSYGVDHVEYDGTKWMPISFSFRSPYSFKCVTDFIEIPCGQCIGCRLEYSRQWANRCLMELGYHKSSYFVTLTYDDEHVPLTYYAGENDEAQPLLTLCKRDVQLFMKRLRKALPEQNIRYFLAGEYGSKTFRPHYHAIIFGLELNDLVFYKNGPDAKYQYYNSDTVQRAWSVRDENGVLEPLGFAVVGQVTWEACAYTARYIMKKHKGESVSFYDDHNLVPEFTLMSRKPGIGRHYYDDNPNLYDYDYINIKTEKGGRKFKPPRYFDKLFDLDNPEEMARLKEIRKESALDAQKIKLSKTNLSYLEMLEVEERTKENQLKRLVRSIEV